MEKEKKGGGRLQKTFFRSGEGEDTGHKRAGMTLTQTHLRFPERNKDREARRIQSLNFKFGNANRANRKTTNIIHYLIPCQKKALSLRVENDLLGYWK